MSDEIKEINIKFPGQILDYVDTREHLLELFNYITNLQEENERLNNIINELEKWLEEKQILYGINYQGFSWGVCGEALDKLQELKGSDKSEE